MEFGRTHDGEAGQVDDTVSLAREADGAEN